MTMPIWSMVCNDSANLIDGLQWQCQSDRWSTTRIHFIKKKHQNNSMPNSALLLSEADLIKSTTYSSIMLDNVDSAYVCIFLYAILYQILVS